VSGGGKFLEFESLLSCRSQKEFPVGIHRHYGVIAIAEGCFAYPQTVSLANFYFTGVLAEKL
jgi:hypothetical protein